jgi:regulator of ribonuclease activity A
MNPTSATLGCRMTLATTDLCDLHPEVEVCDPLFADFGGKRTFHGSVRTLKVFEDNALQRSALETPGAGNVLVVDGGGSVRCALLAGQLGKLGAANGWAGLVIHGCVRDSAELAGCQIGVKALATHPRKSEKGLHGGRLDGQVRFAGVTFHPGMWLYADEDGIVVSERPIHE